MHHICGRSCAHHMSFQLWTQRDLKWKTISMLNSLWFSIGTRATKLFLIILIVDYVVSVRMRMSQFADKITVDMNIHAKYSFIFLVGCINWGRQKMCQSFNPLNIIHIQDIKNGTDVGERRLKLNKIKWNYKNLTVKCVQTNDKLSLCRAVCKPANQATKPPSSQQRKGIMDKWSEYTSVI